MAAPILAGAQRQAKNTISRALRPQGTSDWLLVATFSGDGFVRCETGQLDLARGDLLLFKPGAAQDYGHRDEQGRWRNVWIHFRPREDWLRWLTWPSVGQGVMLRREGEGIRRLAPLLQRIAHASDGTVLGRQIAMNALEQLILTLARAPDPAEPIDPRLQKAVDYIARDPTARMDLSTLATVAGLSRSRLASLFREQTGQTSQAYVERFRLVHAAQLLQDGQVSVASAAQTAGFSNPFYFSTRFRKMFGATPNQYRRTAKRSREGPTG